MKLAVALAIGANAAPKDVSDPFEMPPASFFEGPAGGERRYKDLHAITLHYNPDFDHRKFWYYGCHCLMLSDRAMSTRGKGKPVDQLDDLCKQYKECVHCTKMEHGKECIPEAVKYRWEVNQKGIVVGRDPKGSCKRSLYECDNMYATKLAATNAMKDFTTDYHGYWTTTGFDHREPGYCIKRGGVAEPECCGGYDTPFILYNALNVNKQCCDDGTVQAQCN